LAYDAPQIESGAFSNRIGIDGRFAVSSQQTALFSISPDFLNIEQQIAGVSFVHTERFLKDARPFFTERGDYFNPIGEFEFGIPFYSNRIGPLSFGTKFYGQISPTSKLGAMALEESNGSSVTFTNLQVNPDPTLGGSVFATTYMNGGSSDLLVGATGNKKWGQWFGHFSAAEDSVNHQANTAGNVALGYQGPKFLTQVQGIWVDTSFNPILAYIPWQGRRGAYAYSNYSDTIEKGPIHDWNASIYTPAFYQPGGIIQELGVEGSLTLNTRADQSIAINRNLIDYQSGTDDNWDITTTFNASNRFRQFGLEYLSGTQNSIPSRYLDVKGSTRVLRSMDIGFEQSILSFSPGARQSIASLGWQIDSKRSITGRFVDTDGFQNFFLSFKNAGGEGAETYLIIGDPNALTFAKRVSLKFVWAF
jgi:hypothetical protein